MNGVILKAISGFYYVASSGAVYECKARGSFRKAGVSPVVGDRVEFEATDSSHGVVNSVLERRNELSRPVIANIDKLFIVSSYTTPHPDALLIDRLTAIAVYRGIEPVIVFNKCDMGDFAEWSRIYKNAGFKTFVVSAATGEGIEQLKAEVSDCISAFAGNSGVGKSSILNAIFGETMLKTGEVSEKLGRGRHTTRHTELYPHTLGGFVADTPGFSSLDIAETSYEFKVALPECFPEFAEYEGLCRFTGCTHTCEKGCAVLEAVKEGRVEKTRHESYKQLCDELKDIKQWTNKK